jgi:phage terminase large subunit
MEKTIEIPLEFKRLFDKDWREAALYGGRNSLKSHSVARYLLIRARQEKTRVACFREFQNSISESSHQLLADLIAKYELNEFEVTKNSIVNKLNGSDFLFKGLWHNEQSIKSIEGIDIAWVEEAQTVSNTSIEVLTPTVRKQGSQIIYTYNRLLEDDPVHQRLIIEGRPNTLVINVNYDIAIKNGMMADVLRLEMEDDKERRPSLYRHKWLGEPNS